MTTSPKTWLALVAGSALMSAAPQCSLGEEVRSYLTEIPQILAQSPPNDWTRIPDEDLLYFDLPGGTFVMELATFASPDNISRLRALTRSKYYDNSAVVRAHENYVVQWGDPTSQRSVGDVPLPKADERKFVLVAARNLQPLDGVDTYASQTGFVEGFPVASDGQRGWITHCHGIVGVVHDDPKDTAGGTFFYAVIGHLPRELDGKLPIAGRIIQGIDILSTLPRGEGVYGFYPTEKSVPIARVRVGSDVPAGERRGFEKLRTDSQTFVKVLTAKRGGDGAKRKAAAIDICSVPLPVRQVR